MATTKIVADVAAPLAAIIVVVNGAAAADDVAIVADAAVVVADAVALGGGGGVVVVAAYDVADDAAHMVDTTVGAYVAARVACASVASGDAGDVFAAGDSDVAAVAAR